jgi:hypothetical protein
MPAILALAGVLLTPLADEYPDSMPKLLTADLIPHDSKVSFNSVIQDHLNSDIGIEQLAENFNYPNLEVYFNNKRW